MFGGLDNFGREGAGGPYDHSGLLDNTYTRSTPAIQPCTLCGPATMPSSPDMAFTKLTLALSTLRGAMLWSERETEYLMSHRLSVLSWRFVSLIPLTSFPNDDVAFDQAKNADHSSVYGSTTCTHADRRRGLARVAQRYRGSDTMPNVIHKARRFLPLVCYLVTGTAVTTVSQVIANKVNERLLCRQSAILLMLIVSIVKRSV